MGQKKQPTADDSVSRMIGGIKRADHASADQLWSRFFDRLVGFARKKLNGMPRREADEEDVALSVFKSLCLGAARGRFEEMSNQDDLWRILVALTRKKAVDSRRREYSQKRDARRNAETLAYDVPDDEPTPALLAEMSEQQQRLLDLLRDDELRDIAVWKMNGDTNEEIAERLGKAVRTIERKVRLIREKWKQELGREE